MIGGVGGGVDEQYKRENIILKNFPDYKRNLCHLRKSGEHRIKQKKCWNILFCPTNMHPMGYISFQFSSHACYVQVVVINIIFFFKLGFFNAIL